MKKALFPGTFDPPTLGHLNVILRASKLFDKLYVAVGASSQKTNPSFSMHERFEMLKTITSSIPNVEVFSFEGLLVDFMKKMDAQIIIKSFRTIADLEYELTQAELNNVLGGVETVFLAADPHYQALSSSLIKEIALHGKRLEAFVPKEIEPVVFERLTQ